MPVYQDVIEAIRNNEKTTLYGLDGSSDGFPLLFYGAREAGCYRRIVNALFEICQGNEEKADACFTELLRYRQPFELISDIIKALNSYRDDLS